MIEVLTGLPGNAKTLKGLELWINRAADENRDVYWSGLKEFKADDPRLKGTRWIEMDPLRWHLDVPPGSLIFMDEAQKAFRNRSITANPPMYVTELEEHRHKGLDFLMITQHPRLLDPAVRVLTQTHYHMVRIFGMEASTVHKWNGIKEQPDKSRADSESSKWAFRKDLYGLYKSADAHTMKRSIPFRVKLLAAVPVLLALCGWYVYKVLVKKPQEAAAAQVAVVAPGSPNKAPGALPGAPGTLSPKFDPVADAQKFIASNTPRVVGLPQTAPKYDALTVPTRVPVPAACIQGEDKCRCFTQQGTSMDIEYSMCKSFARNGFFQEFNPDQDKRDSARTAASVAVLQNSPVGVHSAPAPASPVIAFAAVPER